MKCFNHPEADALAACVYCGAGMCAACARKTLSGRFVCSPGCGEAAARAEAALAGLGRKTRGGHRLTGYFCGGSALVVGVLAARAGLDGGLELFLPPAALALGLAAAGFFYLRLANHEEAD